MNRQSKSQNKNSDVRCWAIIPAAGSGTRMGAHVSKQYLCIAGQPVIHWAMQPFLDEPRVSGLVVVLAPDDSQWSECAPKAGDKLFLTAHGGSDRAISVRNGLRALAGHAKPGDWVLIHDAARPCLSAADLDCLLGRLWEDEVGGLLASPVRDTLKKAADLGGVVQSTMPRTGMWLAQTPQMFRFAALCEALDSALAGDLAVTDESSAMELAGYSPHLIESRPHNFKITYPQDLRIAEWILSEQS